MASFNELKKPTYSKGTATTQSAAIQEAFKKYYDLMRELSSLCYLYHSVFNKISRLRIRETILHKKVLEEDKQKLDNDLTDLEKKIKLITNILQAHIDDMEDMLKNEAVAVTAQEAYQINRDHIGTMNMYHAAIQLLEGIQYYDCPERMRVSLYILETKKKALHIAIKEYNNKNLRLMDYKLMDVQEAEEEAKNEIHNMLYTS